MVFAIPSREGSRVRSGPRTYKEQPPVVGQCPQKRRQEASRGRAGLNQTKPDLPPSYEEATSAAGLHGPGAQSSDSTPPLEGTLPSRPPLETAMILPRSSSARRFPQAFNIYLDDSGLSFTLGEHRNTPIYAGRFHPSSAATLGLYAGPSAETSPMLATVVNSAGSGDATISLLPLTSDAPPVEVTIASHRFRVEIGIAGGVGHPEIFEWRNSRGKALVELEAHSGWELVRMAQYPPPGVTADFEPGKYETDDGREVVAVWAEVKLSSTKSAKFKFLDTGSAGVLGEQWEMVAVVSALGLWEKQTRAKRWRES
ncbi:uncharacterized protein E0L32_007022 [Thyridium curvatum]|uniref:Uncharacterized protein n=1 Tax=Thyridium curvatum TaxID=1093900 RepID=A0A507ANJ8_9PEZI|nr:uncharacterized protein E0L32_007022 [Thyridium curvatum]TPX12375.1 hypothetical protein E0L32_007022 [Thyridium curvatum]